MKHLQWKLTGSIRSLSPKDWPIEEAVSKLQKRFNRVLNSRELRSGSEDELMSLMGNWQKHWRELRWSASRVDIAFQHILAATTPRPPRRRDSNLSSNASKIVRESRPSI